MANQEQFGPETSEAAEHLAQAIGHINQGRFAEAARICNGILANDPENVQALNVLGGSLTRSGNIGEAIRVAEKVCSLTPGDAFSHANVGYLYGLAGNVPQAMLSLARAVIADPDEKAHRARFAHLVENIEFYRLTAETDIIGEAIRICLDRPGTDAESFSTAWHSLLLLNPEVLKLADLAQGGDFDTQAGNVAEEDLEGVLSDPFMLLGIRSLHVMNARLERLLTFLRRLFLVHFDDAGPEPFLPFLRALAEHCRLNEYIYNCTDEELAAVDALESSLEPAADDPAGSARLAVVRCYRDAVRIDKPDIAALSPTTGASRNAVSSSVARQYEENPYPRWRHLEIPRLSDQQKAKGRGRQILVAGCGTGYEPLNLAAHYPEARVLGVDISRPSLAYGKQKAAEFGIDNVEFMQADILDLENLDRQFDLVSSVGVLHHMEDPVEGWRKLLSCLKPDGFMKIALYSEAARQSVVQCRAWIGEKGFEPTPEGIRTFRQAIMALDEDDPLRDIMNWTDFWSMSMCRDLVFHVQEHRVTLPWIKSTLDDLGLVCLSMRISNPVFRKEYLSTFPSDRGIRNLDTLHEYERHNPATFRDMYQFRCCRKGSPTAARPPEWFFTAGL